ncbi:MAG: pyridoxamine 5'-phosphate oxidase family protein [Candidatus Thorarchaeota archaeon]|jgi:general stress protein 26
MQGKVQTSQYSGRKWIYEEIVEKVPPFRWLPPTYDVLAQLLLVEAVGIAGFLYFEMPLTSVIYGTLAILYTVVWSAGCLYVIPWLRRLRNPTNKEEKRVLESYKNRLLLDRKYEFAAGITLFAGVWVFIYLDPTLLQAHLGTGYGNPFLMALLAVLIWDVSYRIGLSLVTTLFAARRSISLSRAARRRRGLEYTAYSEVRTLKYLDSVNLYWAASAVLLLPLASITPMLLYGLGAFFAAVLFLSGASLLAMERVPWFPPDVEGILYKERFAYVALCEKNQSHVTPVIFVYDGKYLYFGISLASAKYRKIKNNAKIAVLVDLRDSKNVMNNRAVMLRGQAMILGEINPLGLFRLYLYGLWMLRVRSLFSKKYPRYMKYYDTQASELPLAWQNKPFVSRVMVRVEPEKITYWREAKPQILRV